LDCFYRLFRKRYKFHHQCGRIVYERTVCDGWAVFSAGSAIIQYSGSSRRIAVFKGTVSNGRITAVAGTGAVVVDAAANLFYIGSSIGIAAAQGESIQ